MTPKAILNRLRDLGVTVVVDGQKLRLRPASKIPAEVRAGIDEHRNEIVAEIRAQQSAVETEPMPADHRSRAAWLGRLARLAGIDAAGLFRLIDETLGVRTLGPYQMTAAEVEKVAALIRAELGTRTPVVDPQFVGGAGADMGSDPIPRSISLKTTRGWSDQQFSALCRRVLGRPGLRSAADDQEVLAVARREFGAPR